MVNGLEGTDSKWNLVIRFINQVGFPVAVTAFLLWRLDGTLQVFSDRLNQLTQSFVVSTTEQRALISEQRATNELLRARLVQSEEELRMLRGRPLPPGSR